MAIAHKFGIPVMVHTSAGVRFAHSSRCVPAAQEYPGRKVIHARAECAALSSETQVTATAGGNLHLETSQYRVLNPAPEVYKKVLGETAADVFNLK